jgi:sugar/nucleoside kinase (ribokinase family)
MDKILKFSNVAGGLSVTKYGGRNSIFSLEEVEEKYNEIK